MIFSYQTDIGKDIDAAISHCIDRIGTELAKVVIPYEFEPLPVTHHTMRYHAYNGVIYHVSIHYDIGIVEVSLRIKIL